MSYGILVANYNNYFNRIVKIDDLNTFLSNPNSHVVGVDAQHPNGRDFNFNPADGVSTVHIFEEPTWNNPDYLVIFDGSTIVSRWFIMEAMHLSAKKKYRCSLRRDLVADYYDQIAEAPCFVERAVLNSGDVALYNQEPGLPMNEIKKQEILLKDDSLTPWIVGYFQPKDIADIVIPDAEIRPYATVRDLENDTQLKPGIHKIVTNKAMSIYFNVTGFKNCVRYDLGFSTSSFFATSKSYSLYSLSPFTSSIKNTVIEYGKSKENEYWNKFFELNTEYEQETELDYYNNKIVFDETTQKFYRIEVTKTPVESSPQFIDKESILSSYIGNDIQNNISYFLYSTSFPREDFISIRVDYFRYNVSIVEVYSSSYKTSMHITNRTLIDAPYAMFMMPLEEIYVINGEEEFYTSGAIDSLNIATRIVEQLGTNCYDVQLVPYSTLDSSIMHGQGVLDITDLTISKDYEIVYENTDTPSPANVIFFARTANKSFNLDYETGIEIPEDPVEFKLMNQAKKVRLTSPNYAASFEFSPTKNRIFDKINVDVTLKPFSPYIHLNPKFSGLYGSDFNDTRGLICQGDFSVPRISDAWVNYTINNKNYLNAFNRQIENMEVNQKYEKTQSYINAVAGSIGAAGAGFQAGGAIGAVAAGAASLGAGLVDASMQNALRLEQKSYTLDQFNYSIQNIKAIPDTLAKVSAYDLNNKMFPVLEIYDCTEQEKDYFRLSMQYQGMLVGRIGTMNEFAPGFFKGRIIRLDTISEDTHLVQEIVNEIMRGVYK